ncbi:alpha/beta hydrolase [Streptomyces sp. NPDC015220]|uniref:alpha/beta hydrolase n=1 Tax=Streptomyces sp. NPDC015220 TaxID=3364947 RepID=UPI0036FBC8AD
MTDRCGPRARTDPLTVRARELADAMSAGFPDPALGPVEPAAIRRASRAGAGRRPVRELPRVTDRSVPGPAGAPEVPVRIYEPVVAPAAAPAVVVFFHGGGWVLCGLDSHDGLCRELAARTNAVVVSVDFRLAPEHRFPSAAEDAWAATAWVAAQAARLGWDPGRLAVAGDSSGGNLAAAVALMARDRGGPALAAQLLAYPVLDHRMATESYRAYATGFFHTTAHMRWYWEQYLGEEGDGSHPYASPGLAADLAGVPPAVLVLPECDPLRDDALAYAGRLEAAGAAPRVRVWPGTFHGFLGLTGLLPEADRALAEAARDLRAALEPPGG